jgi:hypothetical protein
MHFTTSFSYSSTLHALPFSSTHVSYPALLTYSFFGHFKGTVRITVPWQTVTVNMSVSVLHIARSTSHGQTDCLYTTTTTTTTTTIIIIIIIIIIITNKNSECQRNYTNMHISSCQRQEPIYFDITGRRRCVA